MCTCIQVALFHIVAALSLFNDQLTLGPLRDLAQHKPLYLAIDIALLVVSSITKGDRRFLINPYSASCPLGDLGKGRSTTLGSPLTLNIGLEIRSNGEQNENSYIHGPHCRVHGCMGDHVHQSGLPPPHHHLGLLRHDQHHPCGSHVCDSDTRHLHLVPPRPGARGIL